MGWVVVEGEQVVLVVDFDGTVVAMGAEGYIVDRSLYREAVVL